MFGGTGNDGIDVSGDQAYGFQDEVYCGPGVDDVLLGENDSYATGLDGAQECKNTQVIP